MNSWQSILMIAGGLLLGSQGLAGQGPVTGSAGESGSRAPAPRSHAVGDGGITVDGVLVDRKADPPCYPSAGSADQYDRFINCGNGTVHDTVTGLLWLWYGSGCVAAQDWWAANAHSPSLSVADLHDGQCGLTDHSQPGDWRLPTPDEWQTILDPSCPDIPGLDVPKIVGKAGGCYADPSNAWALTFTDWLYWSSSSVPSDLSKARAANLEFGFLWDVTKTTSPVHSWPVRDGG